MGCKINIIDEFDTHHNYLQSNFNYVLTSISYITNDIYKYIFDFIHMKIKNTKYFNIGSLLDTQKVETQQQFPHPGRLGNRGP